MKTFFISRIIFVVLLVAFNRSFAQESLFPQISGWEVIQEGQVYDPGNLWDIINGAADLYLEYNFVDLHIAQYKKSNIEIKAELYRHSTAEDAFGIYSQERDPNYDFISVGAQGYAEPGILNFLDGVFYIKLSSYQNDDTAQEALLMLANAIDNHLKQENSFPQIIKLLPDINKQANSEQYITRNFLGYGFLNSAATAMYLSEDGNSFKAFVIETESVEQSQSYIKEYINTVTKENVREAGDGRYIIQDPYNGQIEIAIENNFIYGIVNCSNEQFGNDLMKEIRQNL